MIPELCHGAETWALTKTQVMKLQKTQRAIERIIMGIKKTDKINKDKIRKETICRMVDIGYVVQK